MLTLKYIQENPETVIDKLAKKRFDAREIVNAIVKLTNAKNQTQVNADKARAEMNLISKEIGQLMRTGKIDEAKMAKERTAELKESIRKTGGGF